MARRRQLRGPKIATLRFATPDARRRYLDALRERLYSSGFEPHQVTAIIRTNFPNNAKVFHISGTDDAERACDVASEVRGVHCRLSEDE